MTRKGKRESYRGNRGLERGRGVRRLRFCIGLVVKRVGGSTILQYLQHIYVTLGS